MSNFGEQINLIIDNLSQKLGIAADKLYPALRKQALIDGITGTVWCLVAIITIVVLIIKIVKWFKPVEDQWKDRVITDTNKVKIAIGFIFMFVALIIFGVCFNSSVTALFNPDYYIVNQIVNQIKQ